MDASPPAWAPPRAEGAPAGAGPHPGRLIRLPEVVSRTGLTRSTIYGRIAKGAFPCQRELDGNVAAWREAEVDEWIASRG